MQIEYPKSLEDISRERQEELERDIRHFLRFSPCQRLRHVEKEWASLQGYIRKFGIPWNRSSRQKTS
jgi:hypothetical protein